MSLTSRRSFLLGLAAGLAPAVIRTPGLLMPVRALLPVPTQLNLIRANDPDALEALLVQLGLLREEAAARIWNTAYHAAISRLDYAPIVEG